MPGLVCSTLINSCETLTLIWMHVSQRAAKHGDRKSHTYGHNHMGMGRAGVADRDRLPCRPAPPVCARHASAVSLELQCAAPANAPMRQIRRVGGVF